MNSIDPMATPPPPQRTQSLSHTLLSPFHTSTPSCPSSHAPHIKLPEPFPSLPELRIPDVYHSVAPDIHFPISLSRPLCLPPNSKWDKIKHNMNLTVSTHPTTQTVSRDLLMSGMSPTSGVAGCVQERKGYFAKNKRAMQSDPTLLATAQTLRHAFPNGNGDVPSRHEQRLSSTSQLRHVPAAPGMQPVYVPISASKDEHDPFRAGISGQRTTNKASDHPFTPLTTGGTFGRRSNLGQAMSSEGSRFIGNTNQYGIAVASPPPRPPKSDKRYSLARIVTAGTAPPPQPPSRPPPPRPDDSFVHVEENEQSECIPLGNVSRRSSLSTSISAQHSTCPSSRAASPTSRRLRGLNFDELSRLHRGDLVLRRKPSIESSIRARLLLELHEGGPDVSPRTCVHNSSNGSSFDNKAREDESVEWQVSGTREWISGRSGNPHHFEGLPNSSREVGPHPFVTAKPMDDASNTDSESDPEDTTSTIRARAAMGEVASTLSEVIPPIPSRPTEPINWKHHRRSSSQMSEEVRQSIEFAKIRSQMMHTRLVLHLLHAAKGHLYARNAQAIESVHSVQESMGNIQLNPSPNGRYAKVNGDTLPIDAFQSLSGELDGWWRTEAGSLNSLWSTAYRRYDELYQRHQDVVGNEHERRIEREGITIWLKQSTTLFTPSMKDVLTREEGMQGLLEELRVQSKLRKWALERVGAIPFCVVKGRRVIERVLNDVQKLEFGGVVRKGAVVRVRTMMRDVDWFFDPDEEEDSEEEVDIVLCSAIPNQGEARNQFERTSSRFGLPFIASKTTLISAAATTSAAQLKTQKKGVLSTLKSIVRHGPKAAFGRSENKRNQHPFTDAKRASTPVVSSENRNFLYRLASATQSSIALSSPNRKKLFGRGGGAGTGAGIGRMNEKGVVVGGSRGNVWDDKPGDPFAMSSTAAAGSGAGLYRRASYGASRVFSGPSTSTKPLEPSALNPDSNRLREETNKWVRKWTGSSAPLATATTATRATRQAPTGTNVHHQVGIVSDISKSSHETTSSVLQPLTPVHSAGTSMPTHSGGSNQEPKGESSGSGALYSDLFAPIACPSAQPNHHLETLPEQAQLGIAPRPNRPRAIRPPFTSLPMSERDKRFFGILPSSSSSTNLSGSTVEGETADNDVNRLAETSSSALPSSATPNPHTQIGSVPGPSSAFKRIEAWERPENQPNTYNVRPRPPLRPRTRGRGAEAWKAGKIAMPIIE